MISYEINMEELIDQFKKFGIDIKIKMVPIAAEVDNVRVNEHIVAMIFFKTEEDRHFCNVVNAVAGAKIPVVFSSMLQDEYENSLAQDKR